MTDYTRLFDILPYQESKYSKQDCLSYKYSGTWRNYSTSEVNQTINQLSQAFLAYGIKKDDKVALISSNRPEWNFIDNGMLQAGAINIPVYPTISEKDYKYIFNDAQIRIVFVENQELYNKIANIKSEIPSLEKIYSIEKLNDCEDWQAFMELGKDTPFSEVKAVADTIKGEDLATIIYTSGTTGNPKGVMLSHDNIISNIKSVKSIFPIDNKHKALSFLPLCHIFERTVSYAYMVLGVSIYYAESIEKLGDNLKEVKPHFFSTVPRLLEKVYDKIIGKGMELTGLKKQLFFWAHDSIALQYHEEYKKGLKHKIADKLIFSKWREALGGNVIGIVTGAAALQAKLAKVFSAAGIEIREGYGQTETSPVISVNRFDQGQYKFGTTGMVIPGVEVKIDDNGEILVKGPNVMMGYYKNPEETAKTVQDGWLHTGDVGTMVDGKFLKITDRIKALFKTSGGKYVAPAVIEEKMKESRYIGEILVVGENRKFVSALVLPATEILQDWAKHKGIAFTDDKDLLNKAEVKALFEREINKFNKEFGKVEQIKKFELISDVWSIDTGELTPTMKIKRKIVQQQYCDLIEEMYDV